MAAPKGHDLSWLGDDRTRSLFLTGCVAAGDLRFAFMAD